MENIQTGFSHATLMPVWNDFQKLFTSAIVQDRILKEQRTMPGSASGRRRDLAFLDIDEDMAAAHCSAVRRASARSRTASALPTPTSWLATALSGAVIEVPSIEAGRQRSSRAGHLARKRIDDRDEGVGDVPCGFKHAARPVPSFSSRAFALASHQRAFMRGLQACGARNGRRRVGTARRLPERHDDRHVQSQLAEELGGEPRRGHFRQSGRWIAEGVDRSGVSP